MSKAGQSNCLVMLVRKGKKVPGYPGSDQPLIFRAYKILLRTFWKDKTNQQRAIRFVCDSVLFPGIDLPPFCSS